MTKLEEVLNKIAKWKTKQNTITDMRISPVSGFTGFPSPWFCYSKSSRLFSLFRSNYFTKGRITVEPPPMAAAKTDVPTAHCSDPLSPMLFDQCLIKRTKKKTYKQTRYGANLSNKQYQWSTSRPRIWTVFRANSFKGQETRHCRHWYKGELTRCSLKTLLLDCGGDFSSFLSRNRKEIKL